MKTSPKTSTHRGDAVEYMETEKGKSSQCDILDRQEQKIEENEKLAKLYTQHFHDKRSSYAAIVTRPRRVC